jgi:uncharacterized protein
VIVDFHAHIFPPEVCADRKPYLERDAGFAELYASPKAKLAPADDLLASMKEAGIDATVVQAFGWADDGLCREHNDYLLDAAAKSQGRIVAFCAVQAANPDGARIEAERVKAAGAAGLGELRPLRQGYRLDGPCGYHLASVSQELALPLLFHVSEPVGHDYRGKLGLDVGSFYRFVRSHPDCRVVGAHWAGGLPLYGLMPELPAELASMWVDTAATSLLYTQAVYATAGDAIGYDRILWASDYPLLDQGNELARLMSLDLPEQAKWAIAGANAARLLGLDDG